MKRWTMLPALCVLFSFLLPGCDTEQPPLPRADGQALFSYLTQTVDYTRWPYWPTKEALYPGQYPHGTFLTTYVNPIAHAAIEAQQGVLPPGSIVIKENYSASKQLVAISVAYKNPQDSSPQGDYFWAEFTPDGQILQEGSPETCISCHTAVRDNDWLFTGVIGKSGNNGY